MKNNYQVISLLLNYTIVKTEDYRYEDAIEDTKLWQSLSQLFYSFISYLLTHIIHLLKTCSQNLAGDDVIAVDQVNESKYDLILETGKLKLIHSLFSNKVISTTPNVADNITCQTNNDLETLQFN